MRPRVVVALLLAVAASLPAQTTRLSIGGFNGNLGNTTIADLTQGARTSGNDISYTVRIQGGDTSPRTTAVYVRAASAVLGGTKPVGDVQWRRDDLPDVPASWVSLSTTDVLIESRVIDSSSSPWSNGIWIRCLLSWLDDPNATYTVDITFTLQVTAP